MATEAANLGGAELIRLLQSQRELYRQLAALAHQQHGIITGGEPERLLGVLGERQKLLGGLELLGERIKPYLREWARFRGMLPGEQMAQIDQLVGEVNRLLAGIIQQDKADADLLAARKSSTGQRLQTARAGRHATAAYAASTTSTEASGQWTDA